MSAATHIATATFGCGIVPILLRKAQYADALTYVTQIRAEIIKAQRCAKTPTATLKPLRVTSAK
ncbi:hypothetical protein [Opitutus sp. ER46]|uniref:hypothetical protein n=1 Tax=Opitutus sp. ER46 TaxID=2161864 RepID=UPI000D31B0E3|nr:hypothetical protein [Opitutus sp. ER46]PTX95742.1 hypothetical protein DB354_10045 [Opitutus sp. ER46]